MTYSEIDRQIQGRGINATEREQLVGKIGFAGCGTPSEATSIKVSTFMRNSKLYGLGLLLDGEPHTWADSKLRHKIKRHKAEIYVPGMDVTYEFDRIKSMRQTIGCPYYFYLPCVKMEGELYMHSWRVCYPSQVGYRTKCIDRELAKQDTYKWNPGALETLYNILLPVEPSEH